MSDNSNVELSAESGLNRMMNSAVEYFLAGERCKEPLAFGQYSQHELGTPVVVLYAFSIELALKVLLGNISKSELQFSREKSNISYEELNIPHGHKLKLLFAKLPQDSRDQLQYISAKWSTCEQNETGRDDQKSILDGIDSAFEDWRYHFEKGFLWVSLTDLNRAFVIIHTEIRRKFPDFMSRFELEWGRFDLDLLGPHTALKIIPKENSRSSYD